MLIEELPGWFREETVLEQYMREHGGFFVTIKAVKKEEPMEELPKEMIGRELYPMMKPNPMRRALQMQQEKDNDPLPPLMRTAREIKKRPIPERIEDCGTVEEVNLWRMKRKLPPLLEKNWRNCFGESETECKDRAFLHAFNIPIWDSEYVVNGVRECTFFQRPISMWFQHMREKTKTDPDTNLNQSSMLDYPLEHTVHGFNVAIEEGISDADRLAIINDGYLMFMFAGRRPYFYIPLAKVVENKRKPVGELFAEFLKVVRPNEDCAYSIGEKEALEWKKRFEETVATKMYDFTVDQDRHLHITPGYAFNGRMLWPDGLCISRPIKIRFYVEGKFWFPV